MFCFSAPKGSLGEPVRTGKSCQFSFPSWRELSTSDFQQTLEHNEAYPERKTQKGRLVTVFS